VTGKQTVDVSIVAANYNNGDYLVDFIHSIINSTVYPLELIIIDDGSTDNSIQILRSFSYLGFLHIIQFEHNQGFTNALNAGLEIAKAKYIMRADPDDILLPDRIETQFRFMEENPDVDILGSNAQYFNTKNGEILNKTNFPITDTAIKQTFRKGEHGILHATAILKKTVFQKFRYQKIFPAEDYELFSRMVMAGYNFRNENSVLYGVRIHPKSSTSCIKFEGIRQTFQFRDQIFGTKTNPLWIWIYFNHIRHYRNYQMKSNCIVKTFHLALATFLYPAKLIRRLISKITANKS